jgi:uncharacterized protein
MTRWEMPENFDDNMARINAFKKEILEKYKRLKLKDSFKFACHKNVACFNSCCADINIFLTPYDVIRMKNNLGITSSEFLRKYTISPFTKEQKLPLIVLKMGDDPKKKCLLVREAGCSIYKDRPWSCRMYPLGYASPAEGLNQEEFYFLMEEENCLGLNEDHSYTVESWLKDQELEIYNQIGVYFKEISLHPYLEKEDLSPEKMEMFYMASYDIDRFRTFVFESNFLKYFQVDEKVLENIKIDDVELMKFAFNWLKFSLYGEKTMKVKDEVIKEKKGKIIEEKSERR